MESKTSADVANDEKGFTLLEVLIAMMIMVMSLASILSVESSSITASARAREMNIVAMLAKNRMVQLEYQFEGKTFDEFKKTDGGSFLAPYSDYGWKYEVTEITFPNLTPTAPTGSDSGVSDAVETLTKLVTNFLSKAIREVTVTVVWQRGGKEQDFSVATYWVDLNHEFSLTDQ